MFHISLLKECKGPIQQMGFLPPCDNDGLTAAIPDSVLERKIVKKGNVAVVCWLIKWNPGSIEDAKWELAVKSFPKFLLILEVKDSKGKGLLWSFQNVTHLSRA